MARAFEIQGWLEGKKIRLPEWPVGNYIYHTRSNWYDQCATNDPHCKYMIKALQELWTRHDWEEYVEPVQKVDTAFPIQIIEDPLMPPNEAKLVYKGKVIAKIVGLGD